MISIVMPVYKESLNEIQKCIKSILSQTYSNFEYIIIDDNPNSKILHNFLIHQANLDNRIKLIFNSTNLGLIKSENKGIINANGKYIARMDADDEAYKNRLQLQLDYLNNNKLDFVCSNCSMIDINDNIIKSKAFSSISQCNQNKIKHIMSYCNIANGPTFFFKKELFNKIGKYRIQYVDDYDFALRALIYNYKIGYQSQNVIRKRHRKNSISNSKILEQFRYVLIFSKFVRKNHFNKVFSLGNIRKCVKPISSLDRLKFTKFVKYRNIFKNTKSLIALCNAMKYILSSKIIFQKVIWDRCIGQRQNALIK